MLDSNGNLIVVDGRIATHTDHFKTIMSNWISWLLLASGLVTIFAGMKNLRHKKMKAEQGGPGYPPQGVGSPDP